jgi:hypothetical protein
MSIKIKRIEALRIFTDVLAKLDELFASANLPGEDIEAEISHTHADEPLLEFNLSPVGVGVVLKHTAVGPVTTLHVNTYSMEGGERPVRYEQPTTPPDEDTRAYNAMCVAHLLFKALTGKAVGGG